MEKSTIMLTPEWLEYHLPRLQPELPTAIKVEHIGLTRMGNMTVTYKGVDKDVNSSK